MLHARLGAQDIPGAQSPHRAGSRPAVRVRGLHEAQAEVRSEPRPFQQVGKEVRKQKGQAIPVQKAETSASPTEVVHNPVCVAIEADAA